MAKVKIFSRYDVPNQVKFDTGSDSIVDKAAQKYADINYIVANYSESEIALMGNGLNTPIFGDFSKEFTYQEVFDLRENLAVLYDSLPEEQRSKVSYEQFIDRLSFDKDEDLLSLFGKKDGFRTHEPTTGGLLPVDNPSVSSPALAGDKGDSPQPV